MSVLRVYWQPAWPDGIEALEWALLDKQGTLQAQGCDAPAGWPAAKGVELVLPAGHTVFVAVNLPSGRKWHGEALGFAIEEQLANDPAANLYQAGVALPDGKRQVAIVEMSGLRHALAHLQRIGRIPKLVVPEECLLPYAPDGLTFTETTTGWGWRGSAGECGFIPRALAGVLLPKMIAGQGAIHLHGNWPAGLVVPPTAGKIEERADWRSGAVSAAVNFAHEQLLPSSSNGQGWLATVAWTLLALLLLQTLLLGGVSAWLAWEKQQLQAQINGVVRPWVAQAMPGNAVLPMRQALDALKLARGEVPDNDVLLMAAELASLPGAGALHLESLDYSEGILRFRSASLAEEQLVQWRPLLAARQMAMLSASDEQGGREWRLVRGK